MRRMYNTCDTNLAISSTQQFSLPQARVIVSSCETPAERALGAVLWG